jgi:uncharacterized repeat protein (TIGR02543 family)/fimbrial isopeptide formation D2 family protein
MYTVEDLELPIANPTKTGYAFWGWEITCENGTIVPGLKYDYVIPKSTTGSLTFSAIWSDALEYAIIYELSDGIHGLNSPASYNINDLPITISNPTKDGFVFLGWKVTCDNGTIVHGLQYDYAIPEGTTGDITLYAQWLAYGGVSKKVVDGFTFEVNEQISYEISYSYRLPDPEGVTSFEIIDTWNPPNSVNYVSSILTIDGQIIEPEDVIDESTFGRVTFVINPSVINEGALLSLIVTFEVKNADEGISNGAVLYINGNEIGDDAEPLRLIKYDANWPNDEVGMGSTPRSYLYADNSDVTILGNTGGLAVDNWLFIGWSTTRDGSSGMFVEGDVFTVTKDTTLYAQWIPKGGLTKEFSESSTGSHAPKSIVSYVISYTIPKDMGLVKSFEIVDVWTPSNSLTYDGLIVKINGVPTSDVVLGIIPGRITIEFDPSILDVVEGTLSFEVMDVTFGVSNSAMVNINGQLVGEGGSDLYRVTYFAGGAVGEVPVDEVFYEFGASVEVLGQGGLELEGYVFIGWLYDGLVYTEGEFFSISEDAELVAQWIEYGGVTKTVNRPNTTELMFVVGQDVTYEITYTPNDASVINSFMIIDNYPIDCLSYKNFIFTIGGTDFSEHVTLVNDDTEGIATFTLNDVSLLENGKEVILKTTFTIIYITDGALNTAI